MQVLTAMLTAVLTAVPTVHQIRWLLSSPLKARSKRRCRLRYADIPITGSEADHCAKLVLHNMGVEVCHQAVPSIGFKRGQRAVSLSQCTQ